MDAAPNSRKRKALGLGLGALIPGAESTRQLFFCSVDQILPPVDQPRTAINPASLRELSDSIRESGVLQPVLLKRDGVKYRLIAGERRWRAARMAGLEQIPAMVKDVDEDESFALALIENVQREDLTPLEEAMAYRRLLDEHGYTQKTLAEKLGKGRSTIANALRLLDLPEPVQHHLADGTLTAGHARAVLSVPRDDRIGFAKRLAERQSSVREAEAEARSKPTRRSAARKRGLSSQARERRANLDRLERLIREALHTRVRIVDQGGSGKVELFYQDDDTLQEIVDRLLEKPR